MVISSPVPTGIIGHLQNCGIFLSSESVLFIKCRKGTSRPASHASCMGKKGGVLIKPNFFFSFFESEKKKPGPLRYAEISPEFTCKLDPPKPRKETAVVEKKEMEMWFSPPFPSFTHFSLPFCRSIQSPRSSFCPSLGGGPGTQSWEIACPVWFGRYKILSFSLCPYIFPPHIFFFSSFFCPSVVAIPPWNGKRDALLCVKLIFLFSLSPLFFKGPAK